MIENKRILHTIDSVSVSVGEFYDRVKKAMNYLGIGNKEPGWEVIVSGFNLHKVLCLEDVDGKKHTYRVSMTR